MVSVSVWYFIVNTVHIFLFVRKVEEMDERINSGQDKKYDGRCSVDAFERVYIGIAGQVDELQSACNAYCNVLVKYDWVEHKEGPSIESNLHVSDKLVVRFSACLFQPKHQVNHQCKHQIYGSGKSNVVNVSEKRDVMVVFLVLSRRVVV